MLLNSQHAVSSDADNKTNRFYQQTPNLINNNLKLQSTNGQQPNSRVTTPLLQTQNIEIENDLESNNFDLRKTVNLEEHAVDGSSSLRKKSKGIYKAPKISNPKVDLKNLINSRKRLLKRLKNTEFWNHALKTATLSIPSVLVGIMLTILDGVSYGLLIFPTNMKYFSNFGPDGITLFFLSTFVAQFVYSIGGSAFKSANGGFMIEVVPFLHTMCRIVYNELIDNHEEMIVPTILIAFALGSVITGLVFLLMGYFKLGVIMEYFPRHILIGCIGGVGMFLIITGLEITTEVTFELSSIYLKSIFRFRYILKWGLSLLLSVGVRVLEKSIKHPLFTPMYFISVAVIFYILVFFLGYDMNFLREHNWLFKIPKPMKPFYDIFSNFNLDKTDFVTIFKLVPVMLSLTFFGILHVPINVPSLAVSINQSNINVNRELISHGISNILSGLCGSVQNYLIYSNSVLFIRSGGTTRISGIMLGLATVLLFFIGPNIIGFVPLPLVGSLVFHMGIDLVKEAVYDTFGVVHLLEYTTISTIVISMTLLGFVEGIFLGIVVACVFFVLLYSNKSPIRSFFTGKSKRSLIRRPYHQRKYIDVVGNQIQGLTLQGYLFFGSIHRIDYAIRDILFSSKISNIHDGFRDQTNYYSIKYIILDFRLVSGIDFSAADAFTKIQKRLVREQIYLIICGVIADSEIGKALAKAGITSKPQKEDCCYLRCFQTLNSALEWCENEMLTIYYAHKNLDNTNPQPMKKLPTNVSIESQFLMSTSPRKSQLIEAAKKVYNEHSQSIIDTSSANSNLLNIIIQSFQDINNIEIDILRKLATCFEQEVCEANHVLWNIGDKSDCIYICEKGDIKSLHNFNEVEETILSGTIFGDISFFNNQPRKRIVIVESSETVLWKFTREKYEKMCKSKDIQDWNVIMSLMKHSLYYSIYDFNLLIDQIRLCHK